MASKMTLLSRNLSSKIFKSNDFSPSHPRLIIIFYVNHDFKNGMLISKVCKNISYITIKNFGKLCILPYFGKPINMMLHQVLKTSSYLLQPMKLRHAIHTSCLRVGHRHAYDTRTTRIRHVFEVSNRRKKNYCGHGYDTLF